MNIISIDPSLISTALVVNGKIFNYCRESKVNLKKGMSKWYKSAEQYSKYRFIEFTNFETYSQGELSKINDYDKISDMILDDIKSNIDISVDSIVGIEGYNFGSTVGDLIDLVTFSTILRKKIYDQITNRILVVSPSTLKLEACKLTYDPIIKESGKRVKKITQEWRNRIGIPGGKFTKKDIALSIIENENVSHPWFQYMKSISGDILAGKDIQKPHEDINDAIILYHVLKFGNLSI
jgi:hypothetical protein